jgi:hypothetical protein
MPRRTSCRSIERLDPHGRWPAPPTTAQADNLTENCRQIDAADLPVFQPRTA